MAATRPNILWICTDQQRHDTIHAAGNPHIRTPNLDWMLESGVHFRRAYTDAPVCCPARSTMITGRHYHNFPPGFGYFNQPSIPPDTTTLPALLTQHGYQTKAVGKLHYHPARTNYGWEDAEILQDYYRLMTRSAGQGIYSRNSDPASHGLGQNQMEPAISTVDEPASLTRWTVDQSIDFLETRDPTRPFFLFTSFSKPHPPLDPCLPYWLMYQNAPVPPPHFGQWSQASDKIHPAWMSPTWQLSGADAFSPQLWQDIRRAYYALITQIDYNLGLLIARLRILNLLDNTLILFTSDHGEMLGDHHMAAKGTYLEGSARIPMLLRPGKNLDPLYTRHIGTQSDSLVCLADMYATIAQAAGVTIPTGQAPDSISLLDSLTGSSRRSRLFGSLIQYHTVIEDRYKYLWCEDDGAEMLFDLQSDPHEQHDLISAATHPAEHARLKDLLARDLLRRGSPCASVGVSSSSPGSSSSTSPQLAAPQLVTQRPARTRAQVRTNAWPGHHHPQHTPDCLMH